MHLSYQESCSCETNRNYEKSSKINKQPPLEYIIFLRNEKKKITPNSSKCSHSINTFISKSNNKYKNSHTLQKVQGNSTNCHSE